MPTESGLLFKRRLAVSSFLNHLLLVVVFMVGFTMLCSAQDPPPTAAGQEDQRVAKDAKPREVSQGSTPSFAEGIITNVRNKVGLNFSFSEGYSNNPYNYNESSLLLARPAIYSIVSGRIFFNFQKKDTQFHFDYGGGYLYYDGRGHGLLNGQNSGRFNYSFRISRRSTLNLADSIQFTTTDRLISLSPDAFQTQIQAPFAQEVALQRQRFIQNSVDASYNYQLSRKSNLGFYADYSICRFGIDTLYNSDAVSVGVNYSYRLKKWLSLGSNYSAYLQKPDSRFNKTNINRARVGPFMFQLRRTVHLFASGGIDFARQYGLIYHVASFQGGISKTSPTTRLWVEYHRGLTAVIGSGWLMQSDGARAMVVQRLTRRINVQLTTAYFIGSPFPSGLSNTPPGSYRNLMALAGLEFSLRRNLVASLNYYYLDQFARNRELNWPSVTRYNVSFSIVYFLHTLHRF